MKTLVSLICLAVLLSGCSSGYLWGTGDSDSDSDAVSDTEATETTETTETEEEKEDASSSSEPKELEDYDESVRIRKLWRSSAGKGQEPFSASLEPTIAGEHIFTADPKGRVSAFVVDNGDKVWRTDLDIALTAGVGVGAGLALVGTADGNVLALDVETGEELWRAAVTSEVLASPAAADDIVVVQTQDGKVHGLSVDSGELIWRYAAEVPVLTLRGTGSPVLVGDMVVVGFANGKLVGLNSASGELLWEAKLVAGEGKTELERMVDVNTPVVIGDIIYGTSYQGKVGAISRGAGRELWSQPNSSYRAPSYGPGRLYVVDAEDKVYSYRASGGREIWVNKELMRRKLTEPLALEDYMAVADREGFLHILATEDGEVVGRIKVDGDGVSVAMIAGEVRSKAAKNSEAEFDTKEAFFVLDNSGDLTAYRLEVEDND